MLVMVEVKNPAGEEATIWDAFGQLQTCKSEIPSRSAHAELP
jgi:type I restriction enzyme R subunit